MNIFIDKITKIESSNRKALSRRYPKFLPLILESRRFMNSVLYTTNPKFRMRNIAHATWLHLTEHSSPLYRKYNRKELDEGKIKNIKLAIKNINGVVVPPGKVFSFWKHVGRSSSKKGFAKGLVISNGQLQEGIGGGLCQLSNLLAYMFACSECQFLERKHHSKDVFPDQNRTVPFASGATVFFNLIDLKVKNTYPFPIRISVRTTDTQLRGSLDIPQSLDYFIKLEEKEGVFIKSTKTNRVYRCNILSRIYYTKGTKKKVKEEPLWNNIAEVQYDETHIKNMILI